MSTPTWDAVRFLTTTIDGSTINYGVFGYTGSNTQVGLYFPSGVADSTLNNGLFHNLTRALILVPTRELSEQVSGHLRSLLSYCEDDVTVANDSTGTTSHLQK